MNIFRDSFVVSFLVLCVFISACSESSTTSPVEPQEGYESEGCYDAPGIVLIAFEKETTDELILDLVSSLGLTYHGNIHGIENKWVAVGVPEGTEEEWIDALMACEIVLSAERDQICPLH